MRKIHLVSALLLIAAAVSFCDDMQASGNIRFHNYTVDDGLLTNTVYTIFQDRKGFLWFGTQDGVNRFDGVDFDYIAPGTGINRGMIHQIDEDPEGNILIASIYGLFRYRQASETVELVDENLESLEVKKFLSLSLEKTVLYLPGRGLYLLDAGTLSPLIQNVVVSDMLLREGLLFTATESGLFVYNLDTRQTEKVLIEERIIRSLLSVDNHIIAGTDKGLFRINNSLEVELIIKDPENVRSLLSDSQGRVWVGSETEGLAYYYDDFTHICLVNEGDSVMSLFMDRSENIWVGSLGSGLKRVDTHRIGFSYLGREEGLENTIVVSLWEDIDESLWIGTFGGGLFHFSKDMTLLRRYAYDDSSPDDPGDRRIMGLYRDRRGRLWIGTKNKGLFFLENDRFVSVKNSYGSVYTISEDTRGRIWAITQGGGIHIVDPAGTIITTLVPPLIPTLSYRTMLIHEEKVYLGTVDAGLVVLNLDGRILSHYPPESLSRHGLKGAHILSLNISSDGTLWVGTLGGGLHRYNKDSDNFKRYTVADGLPNETVYGILEDEKKRLWISTNRGLALFSSDEEIFTVYTAADGLQGNEFNSGASHKGPGKTLYMGGVNGLTYFNPSVITENRTVPETILSKLTINNRDVTVGESVEGSVILESSITEQNNLVLHKDHLVLTIFFRALHFSDPGENQYKYILEGLEPEWIDAGNRNFSTYTSLPPGNYTFRVKSKSSDGVWSEEKTLGIIIEPEFYQTIWFRIVLVLVMLAALLIVVRNRFKKVEEKNFQLEEMVAERTSELETALEREKQMRDFLSSSEKMSSIVSLTARLAHNLNTPLGSTTTALSYLKNSLEQGGAEQSWVETCEIALEGTGKASQIVQQLSAASSARALPTPVLFDLSRVLEEYVLSQWLPVFEKEGIFCELELSDASSKLMGSISSLQETIDCLFSNALEHAFNSEVYNNPNDPAVKRVSLKTVYSENEALLIYKDNGQGISKEMQRKIFEPYEGSLSTGRSNGMGLFLVYNLIKVHFAGSITIIDEKDGVCFHIKFPLKQSEE